MKVDGLFDVVVPTIGRPSLARTLDALMSGRGPSPGRVVVVDDRRGDSERLPLPGAALPGVRVIRGRGAGPAAARNAGFRSTTAEWVAFLDDDVIPEDDWREKLAEDLACAGVFTAGSQGNVRVPMPEGRRPTDRERNVAGLEYAQWATADMAYRRRVFSEVGGFDERFTRAFREDADLGLRLTRAGHAIERGLRSVTHPVGDADPWISLRQQRGNEDDALMLALHGWGWQRAAGAPIGRRRRHLAIAAAGAAAAVALALGKRRLAAGAALGWLAGTAEFAWARIAPGPRTPDEVAAMIATSAAIPFAASLHFLRGCAAIPRALWGRKRPRAVLLDRDGTLVSDVPYNRDPARVAPVPGAREALDRLRSAGIPLAVVSNQSGVARGLLTEDEVRAVNARVEELLGPIEQWFHCPHGEHEGCACRKPMPGMLVRAASALGVSPKECALIGDTGADVRAALSVGARAVLVPTPVTRAEEIAAAPEVVATIGEAVDLLLGGAP